MKIIVNGQSMCELLEVNRLNKEYIKTERFLEYLKQNKEKYFILVLALAIVIPTNILTIYATGSGASGIGIKAYSIGKDVAKVICLLGWLVDSIKCVLTGTIDGLGKASVKWVAFALVVKFLPDVVNWIFDM